MADLTEREAGERFSAAQNVIFDPDTVGQFAVIPQGFNLQSLEAFQNRPNRITANHRFVTVESLSTYLKAFASDDTMICADYAAAQIKAVIDGDGDAPSHKSHGAKFEAQIHDITKAWMHICSRPLSQTAFGLFLEDHAQDVIKPDAASVMEMVMTFDATKKVTFKSAQRLHDGQRQFVYAEENEARGAVTFPDHFIVLAPIYRGMEPQQIRYMVRYRIEEGKLIFSVEMHDKDRVMREAFDRCVDALKSGLTRDLPIYVVG